MVWWCDEDDGWWGARFRAAQVLLWNPTQMTRPREPKRSGVAFYLEALAGWLTGWLTSASDDAIHLLLKSIKFGGTGGLARCVLGFAFYKVLGVRRAHVGLVQWNEISIPEHFGASGSSLTEELQVESWIGHWVLCLTCSRTVVFNISLIATHVYWFRTLVTHQYWRHILEDQNNLKLAINGLDSRWYFIEIISTTLQKLYRKVLEFMLNFSQLIWILPRLFRWNFIHNWNSH